MYSLVGGIGVVSIWWFEGRLRVEKYVKFVVLESI